MNAGVGGRAPFGYRWVNGLLVVDPNEAQTRKLVYDLFLKHRRKKTVATLLNDLGYRTRNGSKFSDTSIDRMLRDTTAKGIRKVDGRTVTNDAIISADTWQRINNILGSAPLTKQGSKLLSGLTYCSCGGRMHVPSPSDKYVCGDCKRKISTSDVEEIFRSQLKCCHDDVDAGSIEETWEELTPKEKRLLVEQLCGRIEVGDQTIDIQFRALTPMDPEIDGRQEPSTLKTSLEAEVVSVHEPLLSEAEAAKFLGISKMTLLRKRKSGTIGHFRIGFRVLYSKGAHLTPFLQNCEKGQAV